MKEGISLKIKTLFLLGENPAFIREDKLGFIIIKDKIKQESKTEEILKGLNLKTEPKILVRKEEDLKNLNTDVDTYIIFVHCINRFSFVISLAETGIPIIVTSEEYAIGEALDTYEYISEFENVYFASSLDEVKKRIRILNTLKQLRNTKIIVFDSGERSIANSSWYKNPLLMGKFETQYIDVKDFENRYKNVKRKEALSLAKNWMDESEVITPTLEDVSKSARLYIAMKSIIEEMRATAAYVLWCGQFSPMLGTKMCFAISKLNDVGILTGCWRGENLLPMLILSYISGKSVFFGEIHLYKDCILSVRHCAVPKRIANCKYILRRWRNQKGTVTGYCELPKGEVTILNLGQGDSAVLVKGDAIESKDIGGDNCRTTVWVKVGNDKVIQNFSGRELAMVYGDYVEEVRELVRLFGVKAICS